MLGNYPVDGYKGVLDRNRLVGYDMPTRVKYPIARPIFSRLDERTGQPLVYRLEPGSAWLSSTDRRMPCPPYLKLAYPTGELMVKVHKPDGMIDTLGPASILQSSVRTPTTLGGAPIAQGTGQIGDLYHLATLDDDFAYSFSQYGDYTIDTFGSVIDVYGNTYSLQNSYDITVARVLDLDPAELPTMPYKQGDAFNPGLHIFPPVPADVTVTLTQIPYSQPGPGTIVGRTIIGKANPYGYFQPDSPPVIWMDQPGEFRVDITARYQAPDGTLWAGAVTWGNVIEGNYNRIEAHGRRGMDYKSDTIDDMPAWFTNDTLPVEKVGIENYYPYFSGDIHWGTEAIDTHVKGDSIHSIITIKDLTPTGLLYNALSSRFDQARNIFRWPPVTFSFASLIKRMEIGEAPLYITTLSGVDPAINPGDIDLWGYWYGSSERPDVHVREIISEDGMGTAYWRFNDTYGYQMSEPADGDQPGDIKWEFGGAVLRVPGESIAEYAIYSSLWVLLPHDDAVGARVTAPFQDAAGAGINGGPILTIDGQDIDMLFLPKAIRPGDILELGNIISFSGHVGPPLDSRVDVTITSPTGVVHSRSLHANKIGWFYDPSFDFYANETGVWTVNVLVDHDRPYPPTGIIPTSHNTGTVLGTRGTYNFYVVKPGTPAIKIVSPQPGVITWTNGGVEPVLIHGVASPGATAVHYTIHDKGIVMDQGVVVPDAAGNFTVVYDAQMLHQKFSMLSLTAHEGVWEGLSDEVEINLLASGPYLVQAAPITLIGEEVFKKEGLVVGSRNYVPLVNK
jgi:hypothetical protein